MIEPDIAAKLPALVRRLGSAKPIGDATRAYQEAEALGLDMEVLMTVVRISKSTPGRPEQFLHRLTLYLKAMGMQP